MFSIRFSFIFPTLVAMATSWPDDKAWQALSHRINGRLQKNAPLAQPCFQDASSSTCKLVKESYLSELFRSNVSAAYIYPQWETCQSDSSGNSGCLLDDTDLDSLIPTTFPRQCNIGSVPPYYIDLREEHAVEDVQAAFEFSKETKVPLVIKNTGHDYSGRSSAPHSLALWTHNLKNISYDSKFIPEGCSEASSGVTLGAGAQWQEVYQFAEDHNITIVGGSDESVGASGGWLQGGGHSGLSNTMGMGVDRVLQFKIVTPDGQYRVVNKCQNEDLFFALRGGGGGTFGVVLESTVFASPQVTLQAVIVSFPPNATATEILWNNMANNSLQWAQDGWGGWATAETAIYVNPVISKADATISMAPLTAMAATEGMTVLVSEFPSWKSFFDLFVSQHVAIVGVNLALSSRLINKANFATPASRAELVSGLITAKTSPGIDSFIILASTPASVPGNGTSVTPAWRESIFHVTAVSSWRWNATAEEIEGHYEMVDSAIDNLRKITPDAAYHNEAAVHEPNHEFAFWGAHYPRLLEIKKKYDPSHLLDCWKCVGWNEHSPRFNCYPGITDSKLAVN